MDHHGNSWMCHALFTFAVSFVFGAQVLGQAGREQATSAPAIAEEVVSSDHLEIAFGSSTSAEPLTRAQVWTTRDEGKTWRPAADVSGKAANRPISIAAEEEGRYGLYLVLSNAGGASGTPPSPGSKPHRSVLMDRAGPIAQILSIEPDAHFELNREVRIRWEARDANLTGRPVSIQVRTPQSKRFQKIADSLAGRGEFRWIAPEEIAGRVEIKLTARDLAANTGQCVVDLLEIQGPRAFVRRPAESTEELTQTNTDRPILASDAASEPPRYSEPDSGETPVAQGAAEAAQKQYDLGTWHRLRGEYDSAVMRYQRALGLDPRLIAARLDLAGALAVQREFDAAQGEYQQVLAGDPHQAAALRGLAWVQATRRNYRSAALTLERLLKVSPEDGSARLHYGDVLMFMGRRDEARESWRLASELPDTDAEVRRRAARRLELYPGDRSPEGGIGTR